VRVITPSVSYLDYRNNCICVNTVEEPALLSLMYKDVSSRHFV